MSIEFFTPDTFPKKEVESRLGYEFKDGSLLLRAFTRSSYAHEHALVRDNEALEFLGDSVLGLIVSTKLFAECGSVGEMTDKKKKIVSTKPLSYVCVKEGLFRYLILGKGDAKQFSVENKKVLEDLFESIVGAIYLDGGMESAEKFVREKLLSDETAQNLFNDYVSELKELCETKKLGSPEYVCKDMTENGRSSFGAEVWLNGKLVATASAKGAETEAKQAAAKIALSELKSEEV